MRRFWNWWKRTANEFAHAVYIDDPLPQPKGRPKAPPPLSITEKLMTLLLIAIIAGFISWQLAIDRSDPPSTVGDAIVSQIQNDQRDDSWVRRNPRTVGVGVGVAVYILGVITIVAVDRRDDQR